MDRDFKSHVMQMLSWSAHLCKTDLTFDFSLLRFSMYAKLDWANAQADLSFCFLPVP